MTMLVQRLSRAVVRPPQGQRRTFLDWMVNIPESRIAEIKKVQNAGGRSKFTWQKQPQDKYVSGFGLFLGVVGIAQLIPAHYRLATGKGKLE